MLAVIMFAESCYNWVPISGTVPAIIELRQPTVLRVQTDTGRANVHHPHVVGDSLVGDRGPAAEHELAYSRISIPLTQARDIHVHEFSRSRTALLIGGGIVLFVTIATLFSSHQSSCNSFLGC